MGSISNYTTTVDTEKTIAEISRMLGKNGAKSISTEYDDDGEVSGLKFTIITNGMTFLYQMPCNVDGVYKVLVADGVQAKYRTRQQARRISWRIIRDWIEAQIALVRAEQAQLAQVFLPYAIDKTGRTFYEHFESGQIKFLDK